MGSVITGLSRISEFADEFRNKRIAVLTNSSAINHEMRTILDVFSNHMLNIVRVFSPEHGFWGAAPDGVRVSSVFDHRHGLDIISLYGEKERPSTDELEGVDVLFYDIQDVGLRFYTYLYSLAYTMEECGKAGVQVVVLDRPNPLGDRVEGPVIEPAFDSFVGGYLIPVRYGLTIGELARYFNDAFDMGVDLRIIEMKGYSREMYYDETGLFWPTPSPNIPALEHTIIFSGLCLLEGINVSVGRGTVHPFKYFGAPWIDPGDLIEALEGYDHRGLAFRERSFVPTTSKYEGELCHGIETYVADRDQIRPFAYALDIIHLLRAMYPSKFQWDLAYHEARGRHHFDLLVGNKSIRESLEKGSNSRAILPRYEPQAKAFEEKVKKYRIY